MLSDGLRHVSPAAQSASFAHPLPTTNTAAEPLASERASPPPSVELASGAPVSGGRLVTSGFGPSCSDGACVASSCRVPESIAGAVVVSSELQPNATQTNDAEKAAATRSAKWLFKRALRGFIGRVLH